MKKREVLTEEICPACDGSGLQKVNQPTQPGRKIYPAKCEECLGKGQSEQTSASPSSFYDQREAVQLAKLQSLNFGERDGKMSDWATLAA